jgi:hypothetical protein
VQAEQLGSELTVAHAVSSIHRTAYTTTLNTRLDLLAGARDRLLLALYQIVLGEGLPQACMGNET